MQWFSHRTYNSEIINLFWVKLLLLLFLFGQKFGIQVLTKTHYRHSFVTTSSLTFQFFVYFDEYFRLICGHCLAFLKTKTSTRYSFYFFQSLWLRTFDFLKEPKWPPLMNDLQVCRSTLVVCLGNVPKQRGRADIFVNQEWAGMSTGWLTHTSAGWLEPRNVEEIPRGLH